MKRLNNKGFTLIEVIAVIVILAILSMVLIPSIATFMNEGKAKTYEKLKQSILVAAREYVNDYRYDIVLIDNEVDKIGEIDLDPNGQISIGILLEKGYLSPSSIETKLGCENDGIVMNKDCEYIVNPSDSTKKLKLYESYVKVSFNSTKRDYEFIIDEKDNDGNIITEYLFWQ